MWMRLWKRTVDRGWNNLKEHSEERSRFLQMEHKSDSSEGAEKENYSQNMQLLRG